MNAKIIVLVSLLYVIALHVVGYVLDSVTKWLGINIVDEPYVNGVLWIYIISIIAVVFYKTNLYKLVVCDD